jgi:hypothetical protein
MILLLSGVWMCSLLVSLCESWLLALLQLITNVAEHPQARMKLQRGIEVLRAMVKAFVSAMIKKFSRQIIQQLQFRSRPFQNLKDVI